MNIKYQKTLADTDADFSSLTKLYIASKECKVKGKEPLIYYILARGGLLVESITYLNNDSVVAKVLYGPNSSVEDMKSFSTAPFKICRIFKSCILPAKRGCEDFFNRTSINFLRLLKANRVASTSPHGVLPNINIEIESDRSSHFNLFMKTCDKEIRLDPLGYRGIDFAPRGTIKFVIRHFDLPLDRYVILTWVQGLDWMH